MIVVKKLGEKGGSRRGILVASMYCSYISTKKQKIKLINSIASVLKFFDISQWKLQDSGSLSS